METKYFINGMHCNACKENVSSALKSVAGVVETNVDLEHGEASIKMESPIAIEVFQKALRMRGAYTITPKNK
jgi:copper chaperone CopZ